MIKTVNVPSASADNTLLACHCSISKFKITLTKAYIKAVQFKLPEVDICNDVNAS